MSSQTIARRVAGVAIASGLAVGGALLSASNADASTTYTGRVTANGGISVRSAPTTHAGAVSSIAQGRTFSIDCKVYGTNVGGNRLWYALSGNKGWVSARYVANVGAAPKLCPEFDTERGIGRTTTGVNLRQGPTTSDAVIGSLSVGKEFQVSCYVMSQSITGNRMWYQLTSGQWISATYVKRVPVIPSNWAPCAE